MMYESFHPRVCAATGSTKDVELHHLQPFHLHPELELDENNVIWLNRDIHFFLGHLGSWKSYNEDIVEDAKWLREKIRNRPNI